MNTKIINEINYLVQDMFVFTNHPFRNLMEFFKEFNEFLDTQCFDYEYLKCDNDRNEKKIVELIKYLVKDYKPNLETSSIFLNNVMRNREKYALNSSGIIISIVLILKYDSENKKKDFKIFKGTYLTLLEFLEWKEKGY